MEWLRTIDLSEYAPNLRGSGVHGALIVSINNIIYHTVNIFYTYTVDSTFFLFFLFFIFYIFHNVCSTYHDCHMYDLESSS